MFWIGIGHAGTLISAILYLFRAGFRTTIYRCAEAMTVFAVMTAGLFPVLHLGRAWYAYWVFPYPNFRGVWSNFRSPLVWDVFAPTEGPLHHSLAGDYAGLGASATGPA